MAAVVDTFTIEVLRGDVVESEHPIHAVVADRHGAVTYWGDRGRPTIPRSAIKAIQALPIITTGAADAFDVTDEELALACASHSAEQEHVDAVLAWLDRIGLSEDDLECGPDRPLGVEARRAFYADRLCPRPVLNCCSGKHAGFLSVTRHLGEPTAGYIGPSAVSQRLAVEAIEALTDLDLSAVPTALDGCGIPVFPVPLERLAFAMARLVDPVDLDDEVASAGARIVEAAKLAFWVSGTARTEVEVCEHADEPVVIKTGAEGMFMVGLPDRGLGIALKCADGTSRASRAAVRAVLGRLDVLGPPADQAAPIENKAGVVAGELRPAFGPGATATLAPARA